MPRFNGVIPFVAVAIAFLTAGCLETQKDQASSKCGSTYVGRQKAACEMGVELAAQTAKKEDGKGREQKYRLAVGKCNKIEPPLVSFCVNGVNNFRTELAKLEAPVKPKAVAKTRAVAKAKSKAVARNVAVQNPPADGGRSPASIDPTK